MPATIHTYSEVQPERDHYTIWGDPGREGSAGQARKTCMTCYHKLVTRYGLKGGGDADVGGMRWSYEVPEGMRVIE